MIYLYDKKIVDFCTAAQRRSRQEEHLDSLTPRTDATATTIETKSSSDLLTQTEIASEKRTICDQIDYLMGTKTNDLISEIFIK